MNSNLNNIMNNNLESEITNFNQHINNLQTIDDIIIFKYNINNNIYLYMKHIEKLKKLIESIDIELEQKCNHNWKREYTYYGERSQYQCSICNLYK